MARRGREGGSLAVAKVIEISSISKKSFDDAIAKGVSRASDTVQGIQSAWVQDLEVGVSKGKVTEYRVKMKVTFVLK